MSKESVVQYCSILLIFHLFFLAIRKRANLQFRLLKEKIHWQWNISYSSCVICFALMMDALWKQFFDHLFLVEFFLVQSFLWRFFHYVAIRDSCCVFTYVVWTVLLTTTYDDYLRRSTCTKMLFVCCLRKKTPRKITRKKLKKRRKKAKIAVVTFVVDPYP